VNNQDRTEGVCSNCGKPAKWKVGEYRFAECGLKNVYLLGIETIRCPHCKNVDPVIPSMNQLMQVLAIAVACKPYTLRGDEIRFLRKYLKMTGDQLASYLGTDKSTISKWENDEQAHGDKSDRLIRALALMLGEGLSAHVERVAKTFPQIKETPKEIEYRIDTESQTCEYA